MNSFKLFALNLPGLSQSVLEPAIAIAAAHSGAVGVLDLEFIDDIELINQAIDRLPEPVAGSYGIRCSTTQIPAFTALLSKLSKKEQGGNNTVILVPDGDPGEIERAIRTVQDLDFIAAVEVVSLEEAKIATQSRCDAVIAKGNEAAGKVGADTTFVLVQKVVRAVSTPVWAQGGIGEHTAAACFAAGVTGLVLDSQLLLTRESPISDETRARLSGLDGTETILLETAEGECYRLLGKRGNNALERLIAEFKGLQDSDDFNSSGTKAQRRQSLRKHWQRALDSAQPWDRLLLIGQDVSLATELAARHCTVAGVLQATLRAAQRSVLTASRILPLKEGSPAALAQGTKYPILQGAMTRVSDTAAFALSVAEEGALPFISVSVMRKPELERLLEETVEKLADRPWGVGILGFVPEELRSEQLSVIEKFRPPFALIAGGRPDQSSALEIKGTRTFLHVPSPLLLESFIESGARRFIFEGSECGGHVGPRTSFVLWERMIAVLRTKLSITGGASDYHVVFAGGIHDALSAAMVSALAASLAQAGVNISVLMGTAYLFTREALSSGAVVERFQQAALSCSNTVLLETGPGHAIRCVESPYRDTFEKHKGQLQESGLAREKIREELELMNLGRLRLASKGLLRERDHSSGARELTTVDPIRQWQEGMYMIGQVATMHSELLTIRQLHEQVSIQSSSILTALTASQAPVETHCSPPEPIAIVGMSCIFPGASNLERYWQNILDKVVSITEVPESHWSWQNFYSPERFARDKSYSKWGGFLPDVPFDAGVYGIPPTVMASIDPMQVLVLETTRAALSDAGYLSREFDRSRTSVIVATAGHGPLTADYSLRAMLDWKLSDMPPEYRKVVEERLPEWSEDTLVGFLGNLTAGRIANRFDLGGTNFTVDAACASSLAGLQLAVRNLRNRDSDMVLLSTCDTHNQPSDFLGFSKVHALSPTGRCRGFDAEADGIVISEGIATVVLKRLCDAERDGDRIYAVVRSVGGSSDGRAMSLTAPRPDGQVLSMERAYQEATVSPASVGLIEAHGTGTVAGDKAEIQALSQVYQANGASTQSCAIGSVKSLIGHTKCAAGLASLIKVSKALFHRVLPPTAGVVKPNPACNFGQSPFYINSETRPWINSGLGQEPRRAAISAFGFGGTNFHAVLEEYVSPTSRGKFSASCDWPVELFLLRGISTESIIRSAGLLDELAEQFGSRWDLPEGPAYDNRNASLTELARAWHVQNSLMRPAGENHMRCLAVVASSIADLRGKLSQARNLLSDRSEDSIKDPRGVYFNSSPLAHSGKVAFMFPGQGSQTPNMLLDLALNFDEITTAFENADALLKGCFPKPVSKYVFPTPAFTDDERAAAAEELTNTHVAQPAIAAADLGVLHLLRNVGLRPDMFAGHSFGEHLALCAAGTIGEIELLQLAERRGFYLAQQTEECAGGMAAVAAPAAEVVSLIAEYPDLTLANFNSPTQSIISGGRDSIEQAVSALTQRGLKAKTIAVSAAFHSKYMLPACERLQTAIGACNLNAPRTVVYSNTTTKPYPEDCSAIADLMSEHLVKPVLFMQQVERMYEDGARIFIEVGPGQVITGLVTSILQDKPHLAVSVDRPGRNGIVQFLHTLAELASHGADLDLARLYQRRLPEMLTRVGPAPETKKTKSKLQYLVNSAKIQSLDPVNASKFQRTTDPSKSLPGKSRMDSRVDFPNGNEKSATVSDKRNGHSAGFGGNFLAGVTHDQTNGAHDKLAGVKFGAPQMQPNARAPVNVKELQEMSDRAQVMVEFQRSLRELTKEFMETQRAVMLSYLNGSDENALPVASSPQAMQALQQLRASLSDKKASESVPVQENIPETTVRSHSVAQDVRVEQELAGKTEENLQSADELINRLIDIVSQRTGYPPEMLDLSLDLEADLGIDSIKRIEILSTFRKYLPEQNQAVLENAVEKLAGVRTLQGIIDWIRGDYQDLLRQGSAPPSVPAEITDSQPSANTDTVPGRIARGLLSVVELPESRKSIEAPTGTLIIVSDQLSAAKALQRELRDRNVKALVLLHTTSEIAANSEDCFPCNLADPAALKETVDLIRQKGRIGGFIYLQGLKKTFGAFGERFAPAKNLFLLARELDSDLRQSEGDALVLVASRLGGSFGIDADQASELDEFHGALVGMAKTLGREWPGVRARAVDFAEELGDEEIAVHLANEVQADEVRFEVGYTRTSRLGVDVIDGALDSIDSTAASLPIDSTSVILVTGGARGITAELCKAIAGSKPTFVILGRTPLSEQPEATQTLGLSGPRELKTAIMEKLREDGKEVSISAVESIYGKLIQQREILQNLQALESAGARVRYFAIDVRDEEALTGVIDRIYETCGTIDGVIHGAGVIEDARLCEKTTESYSRVFETKVRSALTLCRTLDLKSLKFIVFLSSIVARTGNQGQIDYVSANEVLNKLATKLKLQCPGRVVSAMWGPWRGGMAQSELEGIFNRYGWSMIERQDGGAAFHQELLLGGAQDTEVLLVGQKPGVVGAHLQYGPARAKGPVVTPRGARFCEAKVVEQSQAETVFGITLDTERDVYLNDHQLDGIPVLPMAVAVELMAEAAQSIFPSHTFRSLVNLQIPAGIIFDSNRRELLITARPVSGNGDHVSVELSILDQLRRRTHFRATAQLTESDDTAIALPSAIPPKFMLPIFEHQVRELPSSDYIYERILFHGKRFQGIRSILSMGTNGAAAELCPAPITEMLSGQSGEDWLIDPALLDSAMQIVAVLLRHHLDVSALPAGFASLRRFGQMKQGVHRAIVSVKGALKFHESQCDIAIYDEQGNLILLLEGLIGIGSRALNRLSERRTVVTS